MLSSVMALPLPMIKYLRLIESPGFASRSFASHELMMIPSRPGSRERKSGEAAVTKEYGVEWFLQEMELTR